MHLRTPFQILLLWLVVLGIYYPAIFAGLNSVDDQRMFLTLERLANTPWHTLFLPTGGFYYRPLLILTFRLDYILWGLEPGFYHLENILLHGANTTLVYFILRQALGEASKLNRVPCWPLLGALAFALHPIATESVNWISGRTDLLGGFFVLAATLVLLQALRRQSLILVVAALLLLFAAILSKEVMVFFLPAAGFLIWRLGAALPNFWRIRALALLMVPFALAGSVFLAGRWIRHGMGNDLDRLIHHYPHGFYDTIRIFFKVFGFYGKKLVAPLPLNFAILNVSDHYVWLGILLFLGALFLLARFHPGSDLVLIGWYLILPAVLIALFGVAWTPLAERYIYLPSAFFIMGGFLLLSRIRASEGGQRSIALGILVILFPAGIATAERNLVWQDNERLFNDALKKSPQFAAMNNELAIALIEKGNFQEASQLLDEGKKLPSASPLLYINQARILLEQNDFDGARAELLKPCQDKSQANIEILKMLARVDERRLMAAESGDSIYPELVDTYRHIVARNQDPALEYRAGQLLLAMGRHQEALVCFKNAFDRAPADAFYRTAAAKLVDRLSAGERR